MPNTTIILWDIDGTLLLTGGAGKVAFDAAFNQLYNEPDIWQDVHPDGRTDFSLIKEMYTRRFGIQPSHQEYLNIKEVYESELEKYLSTAKKFRLMPHILQTLESLSVQTHIHHGIATGNFKISAWHKLRRAGLDRFFKFGGYGCDAEDRLALTQKARLEGEKHLGRDADKIILIGDTIHDVACGKAIGAQTIAVCTGSTSRQALEMSGADLVIADLSALPTHGWNFLA